MKKFFCLSCLFLLMGCVTHYVIDGSVRLQLGNATDNCTLETLIIVGEDGEELVWIDESVFPGESSKVKERDFVGTFKVRLSYKQDGVSKDTVFKKHFDGGSVYLQISEKEGNLQIHAR